MSAFIAGLTVDSSSGRAVITIERNWTSRRATPADLPDDMRATLALWLGIAEAWDAGWHEHYLEHERQRQDPSHPITKTNPYGGGAS